MPTFIRDIMSVVGSLVNIIEMYFKKFRSSFPLYQNLVL